MQKTSERDKIVLVRWAFSAMAHHSALKEEFKLTPEQIKKLEDKGFDELEERVPAGTQSGAQVNVASQVTSNTEKVTNNQQKPTRDKLAGQAGDSSP